MRPLKPPTIIPDFRAFEKKAKCAVCGTEFTKAAKNTKYCSESCRREMIKIHAENNARKRKENLEKRRKLYAASRAKTVTPRPKWKAWLDNPHQWVNTNSGFQCKQMRDHVWTCVDDALEPIGEAMDLDAAKLICEREIERRRREGVRVYDYETEGYEPAAE